MLFKKTTQEIFYITIAAIIIYLIAVYHFRLEKPKSSKKAKGLN